MPYKRALVIDSAAGAAEEIVIRTTRIRVILLLLAAMGLAAQAPRQLLPGAEVASNISPERLQQHVNFLASPALKGRATGTPELNRAAQYIAEQFQKAGLEPAAGKSYFQKFPVTVGAELGKQNRATIVAPNGSPAIGERKLRLEEDYIPLNFSDSGEASVPVVFAGYGITAPEYNYDDYAHLDVAGKAVIVLRHEPQEDDPHSVFEGRELTPHAQIVNKAINARNHGARAMILVNDPGSWAAIYWPLQHAAWNGWTPTDLIFPFFLFIMGVSMAFSFAARGERGSTRGQLVAHALRRSAVIFAIGLFLNGFPYFHLARIRIQLPTSCPERWLFRAVALRLAPSSG